MAAEVMFRDVLNYIAKSRLNFSIYQTPFSAQLSLKKSFANHFNEDKAEIKRKESKVETITEETGELRTRLEKSENENRKLKELISEKEKVIENLEDTIKNEKKKNKKERQKIERRIAEENKIKVKDEVIEEDAGEDDNKRDLSNVPTANMYDTLAQLGDTNEISFRDSCGGSSKNSVKNEMMKFVNLQDLGDTTVKPKSAVFGGTFHIFTGARLLSIYNVSRQFNIQRVQLQILSVQSTHLCTSN